MLVDRLIFHQFGNYVLQKIISVVQTNALRVMVLQRIF
jgi:ATP-dependent Clp protease adapter protein ClpS